MARIEVIVSPFYGGEAWTDEHTGITFQSNPRGLSVYSIPETANLTGIQKALRLNALMLVKGNVEDFNEVNRVVVEETKDSKAKKEEVAVEEPKEEVAVQEEKPKATKNSKAKK